MSHWFSFLKKNPIDFPEASSKLRACSKLARTCELAAIAFSLGNPWSRVGRLDPRTGVLNSPALDPTSPSPCIPTAASNALTSALASAGILACWDRCSLFRGLVFIYLSYKILFFFLFLSFCSSHVVVVFFCLVKHYPAETIPVESTA